MTSSRRRRDHEDDHGRSLPAALAPPTEVDATGVRLGAAALVDLQRLVGNAAVAGLARGSWPRPGAGAGATASPVQRAGDGSAARGAGRSAFDLYLGTSGAEVVDLLARLNAAGADPRWSSTGCSAPRPAGRVRLPGRRGLAADGVVGPRTWRHWTPTARPRTTR
jgi:hypothetical protein